MTVEKKVPIGEVGEFDVKVENGVATASVKLQPIQGVKIGLVIEVDATADLELLKAGLKKQYPSAGVILDAVFAIIEKALQSI